MIDIIICDDQDIVREGLATILGTEQTIHIISTASDGQDLLDQLRDHDRSLPQLILLDLKMPILNGIQAVREIRKYWPQIKVLILTTYADDEWVIDSLKAGASGYLLKDTPKNQLIDAIKGTVSGDTYVDPSVAGKLLPMLKQRQQGPANAQKLLSKREQEILLCIAKGLSNSEIGQRLCLSSGTVRNYTSAIFSKLEVSDRTEAAIAGLREGIIYLDDI
ncbi:MAG: response regulator transcription factor [Spirochaetia bacterium]|nr:response regulator transcription factor [Spirochaetia bacterium]MCF7941317.1 response regulator transcription factor [Spirochaetia bacterium]